MVIALPAWQAQKLAHLGSWDGERRFPPRRAALEDHPSRTSGDQLTVQTLDLIDVR
jgi:hypothetical protein